MKKFTYKLFALSFLVLLSLALTAQNGNREILYSDDFESYDVGDKLAESNPTWWDTWSSTPGSAEDATILDDYASSPTKSFQITGTNDVVLDLGNQTDGVYEVEFKMYIPDGNLGYFNILHLFAGSGSEWGIQVYFGLGGAGSLDGAGENAATFSFNYDEWIDVRTYVDLASDWCMFYINGELIHEYQWSLGTFGDPGLNQLGAANFYAWNDGGNPLYYIDDLVYTQISGPGGMIYEDDFESYNVGDGIAASNDYWIEWPAAGVNDVLVSDEQSNSPSQSLKVGATATDDVVLLLGNKTSGIYGLDFSIFIPDGDFNGYYNIQHFESPGVEWACQVWFASNGDGWVDAGGANAASFTYATNTWLDVSHVIDLDEDWIELYIDDVLIYEWQFSLLANGGEGTKMLGGLNLYPAPDGTSTPLYYFDDVAYHVIQQGSLAPSIDMSTSQIILQLEEGNSQTVNRTITNVGESVLVYDIVSSFNEPTMNKYANVTPSGTNSKVFNPEFALAPNTITAEPGPEVERDVLLHYDGEPNSGIGLTNGGQWRVAARFPASMVEQYNGMYLEEIHVFINEMANEFKAQVYGMGGIVIPGAGDLLYEQAFSPNPLEWTIITLDEPVYIDGTDIWIGYYIDQQVGGTFPAGCDAGPPIADGRWISTGVGWQQLSETLPYNWNIRGLLTGDAGPVWLSASPTSGELEAQESDDVEIVIDAGELDPLNVYRSKLHVRSNDPVNDHLIVNVVLSVLVGLNEMGEQAYVTSYPNPTSDMLNLKANTDILKLTISNLLGQVIYSIDVNKTETVLNLSSFETGIYLVNIETVNGSATHKVLVK